MQMRNKRGQTLRNTRHNPERHHLPQHIANCEVSPLDAGGVRMCMR